jgi:drug/metabolite transporter (DMT)-like permease
MSANLRGILAVLLASTAFVLNDALIKLVSAELPTSEILILRGILATLLLIAGVLALGARRPISLLFEPMMLLRVVSATTATVFIVLSLRHLPLATVTVVLQVTPLAVIAGSSILYAEKVSWRRWAAALTGFLGVVLIVRPGGGTFGAAVYVLLTALLFTTTRDLTTRGLSHDIPSIFVAAASSAAIAFAGVFLAPFDDTWVMPQSWTWGAMMISAVCLFVANPFMIMALRTGEIAVVAPFRYAPVPLALLLGYLWWEDLPDTLGFLGTALVLCAGIYTLHRERAGLRAPAVPVPQRSPAE